MRFGAPVVVAEQAATAQAEDGAGTVPSAAVGP